MQAQTTQLASAIFILKTIPTSIQILESDFDSDPMDSPMSPFAEDISDPEDESLFSSDSDDEYIAIAEDPQVMEIEAPPRARVVIDNS